MSFALVPVARFEHLFSNEELRAIAYEEFIRRHLALVEIMSLQTRGRAAHLSRAQWDDLVALHLARWGERDREFHRPWRQGMPPPAPRSSFTLH